MPSSLSGVVTLTTLLAPHNMLRPSKTSLQLETLATLPHLRVLDITFNKKCGEIKLRDTVFTYLPFVDLKTTTFTMNTASASDRDVTLLRSQLEPWSTTALRRRLVADFGCEVLSPEVPRDEVMEAVLGMYAKEGPRCIVKTEGTSLDQTIRTELLEVSPVRQNIVPYALIWG